MPVCTTCDKKFWTWGGLEEHQEREHGRTLYDTGQMTNSQSEHEYTGVSKQPVQYEDYNRPYVDFTRLTDDKSVRNMVKQLRAKDWTDDEIRYAFQESRIDINRYL
jgi:hypothetical protein